MTAPLTPANCDLTDFPFMPLEVARLRRSKAWLICKRKPELAFYMLNLWTACWHERPAGSLEDDDDVLADFSMCEPSKWAKVKADALRGWILCDDGRYYHPTVCEKVVEAWNAKLDQRWRTECGRIKKHNDRHHTKLPRPSFEDWVSAGCPQGQRLHVPGDTEGTGERQGGEIDSKGEGEGERQGEREGQGQGQGSIPPSAADAAKAPRPSRKAPASFLVGPDLQQWARENVPGVDIRAETAKLRDHTFKTAITDWDGTWRNWMRRADEGTANRGNRQEALEKRNQTVADRWAAQDEELTHDAA